MHRLEPHNVHVWLAELPHFMAAENSLFELLSPDEIQRAMRFHFSLHRQRFIITRGLLRKMLGLYTGIKPKDIVFSYGSHGKPSLENNTLNLQFNVSHSENLSVFALTMEKDIGIDIEKIGLFNEGVAKRFFSTDEYEQLMELSNSEQVKGFYQVWSKKEAIIKAAGQGLWVPLADFSVSLMPRENVTLIHDKYNYTYHVEQLSVPGDYQAALAVEKSIGKMEFFTILKRDINDRHL